VHHELTIQNYQRDASRR